VRLISIEVIQINQMNEPIDPLFQVEVIAQTANPQQVIYADMHQCYSEEFVWSELELGTNLSQLDGYVTDPHNKLHAIDEATCGERIVKHLLAGNRGHFGPLENPQITFNVGFFPHSTMQQIRTHRVGVHFSVQSFRYTGSRIIAAADGLLNVDEVFYLRPLGHYCDRQGKKYEYTSQQRQNDLQWCRTACYRYKDRINQGWAEEHARGVIPFDVRQHWVVSANVRSLMHLLDMRAKADAQLECQQLCDLIWPHFEKWVPSIAKWYKQNRWKKARLAP
jgi:thymidylate synthase (FAD)